MGTTCTNVVDPGLSWPPPDPDRIPRSVRPQVMAEPFSVPHFNSPSEEIEAFNRRQMEDIDRRNASGVRLRRKFHERYRQAAHEDESGSENSYDNIAFDEGEESWTNAEGERLRDFGLDEEVEFYDEDDIPLGELVKRIKQRQL